MKLLNTFGNRYKGTLGKDLVASSWNGIPCIREYKVPRVPKTELQLAHRALFAEAVDLWHALDDCERELYSKAAKSMTGCNRLVRRHIKTMRNEGEQKRLRPLDEATMEERRQEAVARDRIQDSKAQRIETVLPPPDYTRSEKANPDGESPASTSVTRES